MMLWATSGRFNDVAFLCCCVDGDALATAKDFERNYFTRAPASLLNGFIDSQADFPNFQANLGCNGFHIFDAERQLKVLRTLSYNQYRDGAFRDLEKKLLQVVSARVNRPLSDETPALKIAKSEEIEKPVAEVGLKAVDSVGHADMDADHERCVAALRELKAKRSVPTLRAVRSELSGHFLHEEELMRKAGFGSAGPGGVTTGMAGLSALESHIKDHRRIVAVADEALANLNGACDSVEGAVPKAIAAELIRSFMEHATLYDSLYEGKLESTASPAA